MNSIKCEELSLDDLKKYSGGCEPITCLVVAAVVAYVVTEVIDGTARYIGGERIR